MAKQTKESESVTHKSLAHAVLAVMKDVEWIGKNSEVGSGNNKYNGIKDEDVKSAFNKAFIKHGLVILPIEIDDNVQIDRWQEEDQWSKSTPKAMKTKQSVFTTVKTKYELIHAESAESKIIVGYGHGIDPQDKGAGKSTTYALKYSLLYSFLNPAGKIDDADNEHSEDHTVPQNKPEQKTTQPAQKPAEKKKPSLEARVKKVVEGINSMDDLKVLAEKWKAIPKDVRNHKDVIAAKEAKKAELTPKQ